MLRTDNHSLVWLDGQQHSNRRQDMWVEFLGPYRFKTVHITRKENAVANALSRCPHSKQNMNGGGEEKGKHQQTISGTKGGAHCPTIEYNGLGS